jgi:tripartite-type tricarboxylate transporter receptor subunit TctC
MASSRLLLALILLAGVMQPDIKARLRDDGADVSPMTVDAFTAFVQAESEKYLAIIKQSGVMPE